MRCAVINADGLVVNIIHCEVSDTVPGHRVIASEIAEIGYMYVDDTFVPPAPATPSLEQARQSVSDLITWQRRTKEIAGVVHEGKRYFTDPESQIKFLAIAFTSLTNPSYTTWFKTMDGEFVHLDNQTIPPLTDAVRLYIEQIYAEEGMLLERAKAATTIEELNSILSQ